MTAVACWINGEDSENPIITVVADSLVSLSNSPLMEHAPKILGLPVLVRHSAHFINKTFLSTSIGFAYSGNSLIALQTYAISVPMCANLRSHSETKLPCLHEIAKYIGVLLKRQQDIYKGRPADKYVEIVIFGYCPISKEFEFYLLNPGATKVAISGKNFVLLLGDKKPEISAKIEMYRSFCPINSEDWWRAPERVLSDCLRNKTFPTIGGGLQAALLSKGGFEPRSVFRAKEKSVGNWFLNLALDKELHRIGPCDVYLPALNNDVFFANASPFPRNRFEKNVLSSINNDGWTIVYDPGNENFPQFSYTIGIHKTYNHPELLVVGMSRRQAAKLLSWYVDEVQAGTKLDLGPAPIFQMDQALPHFLPVSKKAYSHYLSVAFWFYGNFDFSVWQIVLPDRENRLSWHPDCEISHKRVQPVFDDVTSVEGWEMFANFEKSTS